MKKKIYAILIGLLAISLVSASLLTYYGRSTSTFLVDESVIVSGDTVEDLPAVGGDVVETTQLTLTSQQQNKDIPMEIETIISPEDGGVDSVTIAYELEATGDQGTEDRVRITADQIVGLVTLDDLNTVSFMQNVENGYIGHLDVRVIKDDGTEDALVFEYAKVNPSIGCDEGIDNYPTGDNINTFGDKGTISGSSYAWLSSGASGPGCVDITTPAGTYYADTLNEWKAGKEGISSTSKIVALEFEVDNWIEDSKVTISNIVVNGEDEARKITLQIERDLPINSKVTFDNGANGTYTITTNIVVK